MRKLNVGIAVLITSYDRPEMLKITLQSWLEAKFLDKVFVVAEASSWDVLKRYEEVFKKYYGDGRIAYKLALKRLGSVKARNTLLEMASEHNCKYAVMADDDYILLNKDSLAIMAERLDLDDSCGAVGGSVIVYGRRGDPDFFLNLPLSLADMLSRVVGYVFLDIKHGPRMAEFLTHFFMVRMEVLDYGARYDELFDTPTGFREESDFQQQIKHMGYSLLFEPEIRVVHLAAEKGGDRQQMKIKKRMYWKARNNTLFIFKWNKPLRKRIWYIFCSTSILLLYMPWNVLYIFRGLKDGINYFGTYFSSDLKK